MKVNTILASTTLIGLSSAACPNGIGAIQDTSFGFTQGTVVPIGECISIISEGNNGDGIKGIQYSVGGAGEALKAQFTDYLCQNQQGNIEETTDFDDNNGDSFWFPTADDNCNYYHVREYQANINEGCMDMASVSVHNDVIQSRFFMSGIPEADINSCIETSAGSVWSRGSITTGYCDSSTATTGTFYTLQTYTDDQCTTESGDTASTLGLTAGQLTGGEMSMVENGVNMCREFVACSDDAIITSSPTTAPTESPTDVPTDAPTVSPSEQPSAAPTVSPSMAPTANPTASPNSAETESPSAAPTASPVDDNSSDSEPTASPTSNPTTASTTGGSDNDDNNTSSSLCFTSIIALLFTSFCVVIIV